MNVIKYLFLLISFSTISCITYKRNTIIDSYNYTPDILPIHSHQQLGINAVNKPHFFIINTEQTTILSEELQKVEMQLGFKINRDDNIPFFLEVASWLGVPYKHSGNTKNGTDCSGFTSAIYKIIYNVDIDRRSDGQYYNNCINIPKSKLRTGDLVFFKINNDKISHVGIYLKNNKFIHASSYRGVTVNDLDESYYKKYYYASGRVK